MDPGADAPLLERFGVTFMRYMAFTEDDPDWQLEQFAEAADFYRLYMVPGMFHCAGGRGINRVDAFPDLVEWVETGAAPDRLVGRRVDRDGEVLMTRPVCPYPDVARYDGTGDIDDAASFECRPPDASAEP